MATGETTTGSLTAALPSIIASARIIKEYDGTWQRTCTNQKLQDNTGLSWSEFQLNPLDAQNITETQENNNWQRISGQILSSTPQMTQILLKVTDRAKRRLSKNVVDKLGSLTGNAMRRKKDEDYLSLFPGFATTNSPGTGAPVSFGHISAAAANAEGNTTEGATSQLFGVLHRFQIKDIQDEILAGVGTYTVDNGLTEETFRMGFKGTVAGVNIFEDNNMVINSTPDANGAVHAKEGVYAIQGMTIKTESRRDPGYGGGADEVFMTDEYSFMENTSNGTQVFCYRIQSDATAPTS